VLVTHCEGVAEGEMPEPCARCGLVPEEVIELNVTLREAPVDHAG
jgi:hypothetical protein